MKELSLRGKETLLYLAVLGACVSMAVITITFLCSI